ncbi:MAG: hypothetical protein G8345_08410 [Magnetococcales bacterium]|nr:hypothetical protein [Magnetococcales bacterium]NGZ26898.1 hypothetical protein [Magnetococcales bacterium]
MSPSVRPMTFVVCSHNQQILRDNLLSSPCLQTGHPHEVIVIEGASSAAEGFHYGLQKATHEVVIWVHHDVLLPEGWDRLFQQRLEEVRHRWQQVGIIGLYGMRNSGEEPVGEGRVVDRGKLLTGPSPLPCLVDSLDELLLAFPRTTPIRMDAKLGYHLYGSDAVLTARSLGMQAVVVDAPVHHNSNLILDSGNDGWWQQVATSCRYFEHKWQKVFPYSTTCFDFQPNLRLGQLLQQGLVQKDGQTRYIPSHAMWRGLIRAYPLRMNLGSGRYKRVDAINVDINSYWSPDVVADISKPLTLPSLIRCARFGEFILRPGSMREIHAHHLLEHITDLVTTMRNCLDLLEEGGTLVISVPYDLSCGAWQDPTHKRAFNENSWLYYTERHDYLGWQDACFEQIDFQVGLSQLGKELKNQGVGQEEILRTPRAVDQIGVVLRKRLLTAGK